MFLSREGRDLGVAFQAPPGSQASSRGEAMDSDLPSSRDAGLLEPPVRPQLTRLLFRLERGPGIALQAMQEKKALSSRGRGRLMGFLELRRQCGVSHDI